MLAIRCRGVTHGCCQAPGIPRCPAETSPDPRLIGQGQLRRLSFNEQRGSGEKKLGLPSGFLP